MRVDDQQDQEHQPAASSGGLDPIWAAHQSAAALPGSGGRVEAEREEASCGGQPVGGEHAAIFARRLMQLLPNRPAIPLLADLIGMARVQVQEPGCGRSWANETTTTMDVGWRMDGGGWWVEGWMSLKWRDSTSVVASPR